MISGLDPTKVDWNSPSVVYLIKCFETVTKVRDERICQLEKQIAHLREENDQLKRHNKGCNASKGTAGNK